MNKHRHIFKDIHVEFVTRKMVFEDAFDMMRLHLQGRPHTLKTSGVNVCVCACIRAVLWWAMEVSPATACGCVPLWCWQGEGGYEIGAATAVFQTTAGAVCPLCSLSPPSSFSPETLCFICPSSSPVDASLVSLKTSETLICMREKKIQGLPQNVSNQTLKHARVKVLNCYQAAAV